MFAIRARRRRGIALMVVPGDGDVQVERAVCLAVELPVDLDQKAVAIHYRSSQHSSHHVTPDYGP